MIGHLTLRTGYSFSKCYGFLTRLVNEYSDCGFIGICDDFNTFSVYKLQQACKKHNESLTDWKDNQDENVIINGSRRSKSKIIKPIHGMRVTVCEDGTLEKSKTFGRLGQHGTEYIIIAKNKIGLREIFKLTSIASTNFYYRENLSSWDIDDLSDNVFVIPTSNIITKRADYYGVTIENRHRLKVFMKNRNVPLIAIDNNFYPTMEDKGVYECMSGRNRDSRTYAQHILSDSERKYYFTKDSLDNIKIVADQCEYYELDHAKPVNHLKNENIEDLIYKGAKRKGIDLTNPIYKERIEHELEIVKNKNFIDYFLVVADIVRWSKERSLVGPGRGSSAGSLVCHCMDITDVDPIKHDLIFARFIAYEREDLPDIDIDFSDKYRGKIVKYIEKTYGKDKVKTIANLILFKPKSAIGEFAKSMKIPEWEVEATKDSILERAGGDNRASFCIEDTLKNTEHGKALIKKYPEMQLVKYIEGHPKNKGKHAAGVIVCNDPLTNFCGVDNRVNTIHMNKYDAEAINLLKIDILGLRTLSVLEDAAKLVKMDFRDFYKISLEEPGLYNTYKKQALSGIFQFEGATMKRINDEVPMECFNDVSAAQALARPGALTLGGTGRYIESKLGRRKPIYYNEIHKSVTKNTFGIIVFQEQMMSMARKMANFSWVDVGKMRKAASKSMGDEYFQTFKPKFIEGCQSFVGLSKEDSEFLWMDIAASGSYSFNQSHSVSYGIISNWCAYMKYYHGLEFVAAILNNSKTDKDSLKVLREFYINEGLQYESVNPDKSEIKWSISNGKLIGGLLNIDGFGVTKARAAIKMRNGELKFTPSVLATMFDPKTAYDILFPCDFYWWRLYDNPYYYTGEHLPISYIEEIHKKTEYWTIGKIIYHDDIDLNDFAIKEKRGGQEIIDGYDRKIVFRIEDDTDTMTMIVSRFDYEGMKSIIMNAKLDKTWLLIKGEIIFPDSRIFMAKQAANLNEQIGLEDYDKDFSKIRRAKRWKNKKGYSI